MTRLDTQRQEKLEPKRMEYAIESLRGIQYFVPQAVSHNEIHILNMETKNVVKFWPYSGWHSGKDIVDGRGIDNLVKQLKAWKPDMLHDEPANPYGKSLVRLKTREDWPDGQKTVTIVLKHHPQVMNIISIPVTKEELRHWRWRYHPIKRLKAELFIKKNFKKEK